MGLLWPILSGAALALAGSPLGVVSFLGLSWGFFFVPAFARVRGPWWPRIAAFTLAFEFFRRLWMLQEFAQSPFHFFVFFVSLLFISIPLFAALSIAAKIADEAKEEGQLLVFALLFSPALYLSEWALFYFAPGPLPVGLLARQEAALSLFFPAYSVLGDRAVEFFIICLTLLPVLSLEYGLLQKQLLQFSGGCLLFLLAFYLVPSPDENEVGVPYGFAGLSHNLPADAKRDVILADLLKKSRDDFFKDQQLIIWGENAFGGFAELEGAPGIFQQNLLDKNQWLMLGTERITESEDGEGKRKKLCLFVSGAGPVLGVEKHFPLAFAEILPVWAKTLGLSLYNGRFAFEPGEFRLLPLPSGGEMAAGFGSEMLDERFFRMAEEQAGFYVFLTHFGGLNNFTRTLLQQNARAKAVMSSKPILQVDLKKGGSLLAADLLERAEPTVDQALNRGKGLIFPVSQGSIYYRFGWWMAPIIVGLFTAFAFQQVNQNSFKQNALG